MTVRKGHLENDGIGAKTLSVILEPLPWYATKAWLGKHANRMRFPAEQWT